MRLFFSLVGSVLVALILINCTHQTNGAPAPTTSGAWHGRMQELSKNLSQLWPIIANEQKFADPANLPAIEQRTNELRKLAHVLNANTPRPNNDPSLGLVSDLFAEDIETALTSLRSGRVQYARRVLLDTTSYCIQCHTQTDRGAKYPRLDLQADLSGLTPIEKAEFFAATRQFETALQEFETLISDKNFAKTQPFEWQRAARSALAISVKVQKDPNRTIALIKKMEANPSTPQFMKENIQPWLRSANEWRSERSPAIQSPYQALNRAEKMIERAQKGQRDPLDQSQDITYFRASGFLHEILATRAARDRISTKALYLAGIAAENTRDLNFWTMHETYYELCIRRMPHTELARMCYKRLNDSIIQGYSGSAGTQIPPDIQQRLTTLKGLSDPVANPAVPQPSPTTSPSPSASPAPTGSPAATPTTTPTASASPSPTSSPKQ